MKKRAFLACVVAVAAATAGAHVLDEATYFWRFDRDVNGDGSLQTTELRDVRHWGSTNVNGYALAPYVTLPPRRTPVAPAPMKSGQVNHE